jgi:hypothetical protein
MLRRSMALRIRNHGTAAAKPAGLVERLRGELMLRRSTALRIRNQAGGGEAGGCVERLRWWS